MKKVLGFIGSMTFALILFGLLLAGCVAGSLIPQGDTLHQYVALYGERRAGLVMALSMDDVFHSWWFLGITAFLCLNLLLCSGRRLPAQLRIWKSMHDAKTIADGSFPYEETLHGDPKGLFQRLRAVSAGTLEDGTVAAARDRIGMWGAMVTHLGVLILILGFSLGQAAKVEYTVYGLPGDTKPIGDTSYLLTINDFQVDLREDDTVTQYTADITVRNASEGSSESAIVSVNHPADLYGFRIYQNSTGWASDVHILENGEPLQDVTLCAGDYVKVADKEDLVISLTAFYPDYVLDPSKGPLSLSSKMNNPAYLYTVYYQGQVLGMNALLQDEELTIDEYTVTFDHPQNYTLLQIKRDPFTPLALLGALILMAGLILSLYLQPAYFLAIPKEDGSFLIKARSPKGGRLFGEQFEKAVAEYHKDKKGER